MKDGPRAVVDSSEKNVGKVWNDRDVKVGFQIGNCGGSPLSLSIGSRSCICVRAALGQNVLPPGESTTLGVLIDPRDREGRVDASVIVHTNQIPQSDLSFHVAAEAHSVFVPSLSSVNFRQLDRKQLPFKRRVSLFLSEEERQSGPRAFKLPATSVAFLAVAVQSVHDNVFLEITLGKDSPLGILQERVYLETVSGYRREITVYAHVTGEFAVTPEVLFVQNVRRGETVSKSLSISCLSKDDEIKITSVEGVTPKLLNFLLTGSGVTRSLAANITLPSDCPDNIRGRARLSVTSPSNQRADIEIPVMICLSK